VATATLLVMLSTVLSADGTVDYGRQVKPVLAARCFACHGALKQEAGLRLDTAASIQKGGENGPAVLANKSGESLLLARVTDKDAATRMPPESEGTPLTAAEIAALRAWIDQGAVGPTDEKPEADPRDHWAFRAPVHPATPQVKNSAWVRNPIDAFIAAEQEKHGFAPQPTADKRLLLRRIYVDLTGLPPTYEELEKFSADNSPDAYEKVVDRLLASPQYGQRWGRHWMDIWRYSDWWGLGAEVRNSQKHVWHWRDWIIDSLNADLGYDEMVRQMLAADELYPNDLDKLRGTGFLVRHYFKFNRNTWLEETIEHTSKAFLGLTFNCTKCHDHKYDPLSQKDYYRLRAFFEPYQVRTDQVAGESDYEKDGIPRAFDAHADAATYLFVRGNEKDPLKDQPLAPGLPKLLMFEELKIEEVALPAEAYQPGLRPWVIENQLATAQKKRAEAQDAVDKARRTLADAEVAAQKAEQVAEKPADVPPPTEKPADKRLVKDDFSAARPEMWEQASGQWKYDGGKLLQQQDGAVRSALRLKQTPPTDFEARLRFTTTGGKTYRSVGVTFDTQGNNEQLVYLSAMGSSSKLQIAYKQGAAYVYPPQGMQSREVKVGEPQELVVRVRGTLVNVEVNGQFTLAWSSPLPRQPGSIDLITYDAQATFSGFELSPLADTIKLVDASAAKTPAKMPGEQPAAKLPGVDEAKAALVLAEKSLRVAELQEPALRARATADQSRKKEPDSEATKTLSREAARAELVIAAAKSAEDVARAELELLRADAAKKEEAEKKLATTRDATEKAAKQIEVPSEKYTPLTGALKALESNLESAESRNKPFPATSTGRRSALAHWITDRRNPLAARVAVNHLWARHMNKPLVPTVFDFGRKGLPPTHPELLDWLAVELVDHQWSTKHIHRLIVTSNTYQQGSGAKEPTDPENRYYTRMNPGRMESQVVRDAMLLLAGDLDLTLGGPSIDPVKDEMSRRRSLYFVHSHNDHHRFLTTFDDASVQECYRREQSIVPQQALALANSRQAIEAAEKIATRLQAQPENATDAAFIRAAFVTVLAASPNAEEQAACQQALEAWSKIGSPANTPATTLRARTNLVHALLNHNDFVTVR
jgi:hypothetical protein